MDQGHCIACRRPLDGPDGGCTHCGRAPIPEAALRTAVEAARAFALAHARDPWLRSAGLLSYSLRSRRRGFLDDPAQPFTRAALELLWELACHGAPGGISPLAETAIARGIAAEHPALARALDQLLDRYRDRLARPGTDLRAWVDAL